MTGTDDRSDARLSTSRSAAQWLLGGFIALALVATVLMVFSKDMSLEATLAVAAALWAAVIGAVLVTKYRRQADVAETRSRDLRLVYELQLEREIAARRQYESEVEATIREELRETENEELDALKNQVLALRASLEKLLGNPLPEVPLALRPERRRELGSGRPAPAFGAPDDDRVAADLDFASTAPPVDSGRHTPPPVSVPPAEVNQTEMTDLIPVFADDAVSDEPYAPGPYAPEAEPHDADEEVVAEAIVSDPADGDVAEDAVEVVLRERPEDDDTVATASLAPVSAYTPPPIPPTPQRRRAPSQNVDGGPEDPGAHSAGRPVSEILGQLRSTGGDGSGSGRRRRG
ncbi:MAG: hypothetical protein QM658_00390 [Gordonia sp. (in: high G+C Gram-positive bacteria)]